MASSLVKFVQGASIGTPGVSLFGIVGTPVTVSNGGSMAAAVRCVITLLWSPSGSALVPGVLLDDSSGPPPVNHVNFTPDVPGGYTLQVDVYDGAGNRFTQIRQFGIKFPNGRFTPGWCQTPDVLNFAGNQFGWAPYSQQASDVQHATTPFANRPAINFLGNVSIADNPTNGSTDVTIGSGSAGQYNTPVVNGPNHDVATNGLPSITLGGATGPFSVGGFKLPTGTWLPGQTLEVINSTPWPCSVLDEDAGSTPTNRIAIGARATLPSVAGYGKLLLTYDGTLNRLTLKTSGVAYPKGLNIKDFGAKGDGIADDTKAVQNALNALMGLNPLFVAGGKLSLLLGTYLITSTLTFVGDYTHHYEIEGYASGYGLDSGTRLLWGGPAGATMFNAWGLNTAKFRGICFDGGAGSILLGRYSSPSTPVIGAGCALWIHTNQYNGGSYSGIAASAATINVYFDECSFTGVIGGLYPMVGIGDGPESPGCATVDALGNFTIYEVSGDTPPATGDNNVDTYASTTLAVDVAMGATSFSVTSAAPFTKRRGILIGMPGHVPWFGIISNIVGTTITAADVNGAGIPFAATAAAATAANCFPAATGIALPSGTIVSQNSAIANSQVQGLEFKRCNFYGGGWDSLATNPQQHTYACVAVYSGANTEQFKWTECTLTEACYLTYFPYSANNNIQLHNCQFGNFSTAALGIAGAATTMVGMHTCATESTTGYGYFAKVASSAGGNSSVSLDRCEVVFCSIGNPFGAGIYCQQQLTVRESILLSTYGLGAAAQPMSIAIGSGGPHVQPAVTVEHCLVYGEASQISIFTGGGNDLFASEYGTNGKPTNFTHAWDSSQTFQLVASGYPNQKATLSGNVGTNSSGQPVSLPDLNWGPVQAFALGAISLDTTGAAETYRAEQRTTTSCYDVDFSQLNAVGTGNPLLLCLVQGKTIFRGMMVETTATFSAATTLDAGSNLDGSPYTEIFSGKSVPAAGDLIQDGETVSTTFQQTIWPGTPYIGIIPHFAGALITGHLKIYVTMEVVQSA